MAVVADIVTRVSERLRIVGEGDPLKSIDRLTIERAITDIYDEESLEVPFDWDLTAIPANSVGALTLYAAAMSAAGCSAPNAAEHEAKLDYASRKLRIINRSKPDNSVPTEADYF
jgi:hypothetical protein